MGSEALDTVNHPEYFIRCFSDSTIPKTTLAVHQSQSFLYVLLRAPGHQAALLHGNLQSSLFDCTLCKKNHCVKIAFFHMNHQSRIRQRYVSVQPIRFFDFSYFPGREAKWSQPHWEDSSVPRSQYLDMRRVLGHPQAIRAEHQGGAGL